MLDWVQVPETEDEMSEIDNRRRLKLLARTAVKSTAKEGGAREGSEMSWVKRYFGYGPRHREVPASRLIHPSSPFAVFLSTMTGLLLMYTAIVTPITVAFFWKVEPCQKMSTMEFDIFVDSFFLVEIFITFFIGQTVQGKYVDNWREVVVLYSRGFLLFDLATSFPVSFVEAYVQSICQADGEPDFSPSSLRLVRVIKPLRLFKLVKVLKVCPCARPCLGKAAYLLTDLSRSANATFS